MRRDREGFWVTFPALAVFLLLAAAILGGFVLLSPVISSKFSHTGLIAKLAGKSHVLGLVSALLFALGLAGLVLKRPTHRVFLGAADALARAEVPFLQGAGPTGGLTFRTVLAWLAVCCCLVLVLYWPTAVRGYFVHDDFSVMACGRSLSLGDQLLFPNNDHTMPLYRLQVAVTHAIFGLNPVPYNLEYLAVFALLTFLACMVLRELGVNQAGALVCALMLAFWANWARLFAEGYIVAVFPQASVFFLASVWAYLRWLADAFSIRGKMYVSGHAWSLLVFS